LIAIFTERAILLFEDIMVMPSRTDIIRAAMPPMKWADLVNTIFLKSRQNLLSRKSRRALRRSYHCGTLRQYLMEVLRQYFSHIP
jgi:hypothetical protein